MKLSPKDNKPLYVMTDINMSKENGVHHNCFYMGADGSYFFILIELPPTKEVEKFIGNGICSTFFEIQVDRTKYCGQMSLYVLHDLNEEDKFTDIVLSLYKNEFKNTS